MTRRRWSLGLAACVVALAAAAATLHARYPLPYVARVWTLRDADYEDRFRFAARAIAASPRPDALTGPAGPCDLPGADALLERLERLDTTAFIVLVDGSLRCERYFAGHARSSVQTSFSVAKSIGALLAAAAVEDGYIDLDDPVARYVPALADRDPRFAAIRIRHLLQMRSGLAYDFEVSFPFFDEDKAIAYYHPDLRQAVLQRLRYEAPPGEAFRYNDFNSILLGMALESAVGEPVADYAARRLWGPLGAAYPASWAVDDEGLERMAVGFNATAIDFARLGAMMLDEGRVGAREVVPASWAREVVRPFVPEQPSEGGRKWQYGFMWWVIGRPGAPDDYAAIGLLGQFVYVSPAHRAVIVRNGASQGGLPGPEWTAMFYELAARTSSAARAR